jgi:hypothetical protein
MNEASTKPRVVELGKGDVKDHSHFFPIRCLIDNGFRLTLGILISWLFFLIYPNVVLLSMNKAFITSKKINEGRIKDSETWYLTN